MLEPLGGAVLPVLGRLHQLGAREVAGLQVQADAVVEGEPLAASVGNCVAWVARSSSWFFSRPASAGWNSQAFRGRKRISEHGEHLEPVFGGKRANLEAQAAHLKNALFGVRRFQRFLLQKTER